MKGRQECGDRFGAAGGPQGDAGTRCPTPGAERSDAPDSSVSATPSDSGWRRAIVPVLLGLLLALAIGLWWYGYVLWKVPGVSQTWLREVLRKDAQVGRNVMPPDPWYAYKSLFGLLGK